MGRAKASLGDELQRRYAVLPFPARGWGNDAPARGVLSLYRTVRRESLMRSVTNVRWTVGLAAALAVTALVGARVTGAPAKPKRQAVSPLLYRTVTAIDGSKVNMGRYQGQVLMIVNTASKCGNTPQYADLERIYRKYRDQGFVVLGFPANNFGGQEPGSNEEIQRFCTSEYNVSFPMFSKISVKGEDKHPLYQRLTDPKKNPGFSGEIEWNFAKFLVNRKGEVVARFPARQKPTEPEVIAAIERELAKR